MSRIAGVGQVGMNMRREDGIAMIVALMAMLLMSALGAALVMTTTSETIIAGNFSRGQEGLYAADAAFERAMDDLLTVPDWNKLLDGTTQSGTDRKSTRLNSSHVAISYAVFCLKKKKQKKR